jgi:hypothetical protein
MGRRRVCACPALCTSQHIQFQSKQSNHDRGTSRGRFGPCSRHCASVPIGLPRKASSTASSTTKGVEIGSRAAGAIPAASTFSGHASINDKTRHDTSKVSDDDGVASHNGRCDLRQVTTANAASRPVRATKCATSLVTDEPDLAVLLAAWPELSETLRVGIVAMVKAGQK